MHTVLEFNKTRIHLQARLHSGRRWVRAILQNEIQQVFKICDSPVRQQKVILVFRKLRRNVDGCEKDMIRSEKKTNEKKKLLKGKDRFGGRSCPRDRQIQGPRQKERRGLFGEHPQGSQTSQPLPCPKTDGNEAESGKLCPAHPVRPR